MALAFSSKPARRGREFFGRLSLKFAKCLSSLTSRFRALGLGVKGYFSYKITVRAPLM